VFGAFNAFMLLAIIVAAFLTPLAIDSVGLDTTLWIVGLAIPIVSLIGWPVLRRMDREAAGRRVALAPKLALLNGCDLFASVSEGAIGQLAGAAAEIDARAGQVIVEEGQPADAFYVIADGTFGVRGRGEGGEELPLDELGPGDYFGEIGLIEQIPRTATITAQTAGQLLRVDGNAFVDALTASAPSPALLDGASLRLRRTHPSLRLTRSALEPGQ
jgi:hypothetical protein